MITPASTPSPTAGSNPGKPSEAGSPAKSDPVTPAVAGSPAAAPPSTSSPDPKPKPPPADAVRETVESIAIALILAFLFRAFEAEAFVIPTGSMAPTLLGQHRDVHCQECGTRFFVGSSSDLFSQPINSVRGNVVRVAPDGPTFDTSKLPFLENLVRHRLVRQLPLTGGETAAYGFCPNCRFANTLLKSEVFNGDRILVNKFAYDIGSPSRFDVVVFKFPEEAKTNYIKRLVGLPGEQLKIEWGDIRVRPIGTDEHFRIPRKSPEKQRMLQLPVYDDTAPPKRLLAAKFPERWNGEEGSGWTADAQARTYRVDPTPAQGENWQWLRYRHVLPKAQHWANALSQKELAEPVVPQLITDQYAYNSQIKRGFGDPPPDWLPDATPDGTGIHWVGDLTVSAEVELLAGEGEIAFELVEGERRHQCRFNLKTGRGSLLYINHEQDRNGEEVPGVEFDSPLKGTGTHRVTFANVDDRLLVWVDGRVLAKLEFEPGSKFPPPLDLKPTDRDLAPVAVGGRLAKVKVGKLVIERDIYYRDTGLEAFEQEYSVPNSFEEFHGILTNPARWFERYSTTRRKVRLYDLKDSASDHEDQFFVLGDNSPSSRDSRAWKQTHSVERRLMIGKAFFTYWPHGVPFLNSGKGYPLLHYYDVNRDVEGVSGQLIPEGPTTSLPFYPDVFRMRRIR